MEEKKQAGGGPEAQNCTDSLREMEQRQARVLAEARIGYIRGTPVGNVEAAPVTAYGSVGRLGAQPVPGALNMDSMVSRYGDVQMPRAPGKTFTRAEVLAVLRSRKASFPLETSPFSVGQQNELTALISIFENME